MGQTGLRPINYAIPIDNPDKKDNETCIYKSPETVNEDLFKMKFQYNTIHDMYNEYFNYKPESDAFGHRLKNEDGTLVNAFTWVSKAQVKETAEYMGSGMVNMELTEVNNEWNGFEMKMIGVYSKNSITYYISDIAMTMQGITSVPVYDTLGEEATEFTFNQTKIKTCFLTFSHVEKMLMTQKDKGTFKHLKNLVVMDPENFDKKVLEKYPGIFNVYTVDDVIESGKKNTRKWADVTPETAYSISYTSGTTGEPKGAVITHKNLIGVFPAVFARYIPNETDIHISYLPLAHVFERLAYNAFISKNVKIGVFQGNVLKLTEDLALLRPTIFLSVPRLFNKFYDKIKAGIEKTQGPKRKLVDRAIETKLHNLKTSCTYTHTFYDAIVFKKMRNVLGGRVKFMLTGSAPISLEVLDFLKICFSCPIIEGYGQTEGLGAEFVTYTYDPVGGHVGGPGPQNEFKLVDVEEMNYTSKDKDEQGRPRPRGEIWVRGQNVIPGYFLNDEQTKNTFTADGWLMSGDVGAILPEGNRLKIIDRKKNIFKLSQGEYIAPEKLEGAYKVTNPLITDVFVYGDSLKSCLVGVVCIEQPNLKGIASQLGVSGENLHESEEMKKAIINMFNEEAKKRKYNKLEQLKKIIIETKPFGELDLLTTTFKKRRNAFKEHYESQFDEMYKGLY